MGLSTPTLDTRVETRVPRASLETTVDSLAAGLLRYCRGRERDSAMAEEAAQDALLALVDRWRRLGPPDHPEAFAFTIARRRLARRTMRRRLLSPLELVAEHADEAADPERRAAARGELDAVRDGLGRLRPKLRDALLLVSAGGLDTATAAQVLGISPSALKMRVQRARAQITDHLREPSS